MDILTNTDDQKTVEAVLKADTGIQSDEVKAIVEELVAKHVENLSAELRAKEKFFLTNHDADKKVEGANQYSNTVKFLNALHEDDKDVLKAMNAERAKALSEGTAADGGYLAPVEFEKDVIRYMDMFSTIRKDATVLPMSSNVKKLNSLNTDVTGYYTDEKSTMTESQMTFGEPVLTARKIAIVTEATEELIEDSEVELLTLITERMGFELARVEENEFVNGTVSGSEGLLVVTGATDLTIATGTTTTFSGLTWDDLSLMEKSLFNISPEDNDGAKFYMSFTPYDLLRRLKSSGSGDYFLGPDVPAGGAARTAWGRNLMISNQFPKTTATGTKFIVYANLKRHAFIGDRRGVRISYTDSDGTNFRKDIRTMKATKRVAFTTAKQNGIIRMATGS